jgi:hypothetical protein
MTEIQRGRPKLENYVCEACGQIFDASSKKYYHKKNNCNVKTRPTDVLKKYNDISIKYAELQKNYDNLCKQARVTNNVHVNYIEYPYLKHINFEELISKTGPNDWLSIHSYLIKEVYCNPSKKMNMSICIANTDSVDGYGYIFMRRFDAWVKVSMEEAATHTITNVTRILSDYVFDNSLHGDELDRFLRFQQNYSKSEETKEKVAKMLVEMKPIVDQYGFLKPHQHLNTKCLTVLEMRRDGTC